MSSRLKSFRNRLSRRRPRGDDNKLDKIYWKLRAKFRASTRFLRSTWVGPTPTLMGLPVEVRIQIHEYALQHIIDDSYIKSPKPRTPFYGGLALCHTSRTLRAESQDIFVPLMMNNLQYNLEYEYTLRLRFERGSEDERAVMRWAIVEDTRESFILKELTWQLSVARSEELQKKWYAMMGKRFKMHDKIIGLH